jgi:hypothetical protein
MKANKVHKIPKKIKENQNPLTFSCFDISELNVSKLPSHTKK